MLPAIFPVWLSAAFDIPLIIVVHMAITRGKLAGMATGAVMGYTQDALTAGILGVNGLAKIIAGFAGGLLREKFFVRSLTNRLITVFGAVTVATIMKLMVLYLFALPAPYLLSPMFIFSLLNNTIFSLLGSSALERLEIKIGIRREEEIHLES